MNLQKKQLELQSLTIESFEEKMQKEINKKLKSKTQSSDDTFQKKYLKKIAKEIATVRIKKLSKIIGTLFKDEKHKDTICGLYEEEMKDYELEDKAKEIASLLQDKIDDKTIFYFTPKSNKEKIVQKTFALLQEYVKNIDEAKTTLQLKQKEQIFTLGTLLLSSGEITWITFKSIAKLLEKDLGQEDDTSTSQQAIMQSISEDIFEHIAFRFKKENTLIEEWENDTQIEIGETPFSLLMDYGVLEEFEKENGFKNLTFSETFKKETKSIYNSMQKFMPPSFEPMIVPPTHWTTIDNGGFLKDKNSSPKFDLYIVKSTTKQDRKNVKSLKENFSPKLLNAINIIQDTPWQINSDMLNEIKNYLKKENIVTKEKLKALKQTQKTSYKAYQEIRTKIKHQKEILEELGLEKESIDQKLSSSYQEQTAQKANYDEVISTINKLQGDLQIKEIVLEKAIKYSDYEEIFFVWQVDFRGRTYPAQPLLNPQGDDFTKSLLRFATSKPLGKNGEKWFKIHGANLYGKDKISFDERVKWIEENEENILSIFEEEDKFENSFLKQADKPFSFLAFAYEYKRFLENKESFTSAIPIAMDGSNNGFQHITALLKDEKGAKKVNVFASKNQTKPSDIYKDVAHFTKEIIAKETTYVSKKTKNYEAVTIEKKYIDEITPHITRSLTKQNVMTEVYGAGEDAKIGQIEEYIKNKLALNWDTKTIKEVSVYLQQQVAKAIKEELSSSGVYKKWMKKLSTQISKQNRRIQWKTPIIGLIVIQEEFETKKDTISTKYNGKKRNIQLQTPKRNEKGEFIIDTKEQNKGIAPNFIHSLDATHLFLTLLKAHKNGITSFATIHDSFGTHACDIDTLQEAIKSSFVKMHSIDIMETLKNDIKTHYDIKLEAIKYQDKKEPFRIDEVKNSQYFFS